MNLPEFRAGALCLAALIYAWFSSPTPDALGVWEAIVGALLIFAVSWQGAYFALSFRNSDGGLFLGAARALFVFGLSVPVLGGVLAGHGLGAILRDVIPFLFMMLALFMQPVFMRAPKVFRWMFYSVIGLGLLLGLRSFIGSDPLYYLANMPSVLFAAIFLCGTAVRGFIERFSVRSALEGALLCALSYVALQAMVETQQRASLGAVLMAMTLIWAAGLSMYPRRSLVLLGVFALGALPFWDVIESSFEVLSRKSDLVGFNMRFEEVVAVWETISVHPLNMLFGNGWGASFSSPAVADIRVNYTHSLLSSMLLKAGLVGLGLVGVFLYALIWPLLKAWKLRPVIVLALVFPILIDVFLYASFKSLDFGLVVLLARGVILCEGAQNIGKDCKFSGAVVFKDSKVS